MTRTGLFLLLLLLTTAAWAETQTAYISDVLYVNLRSGPGNDYDAVMTMKSGQMLHIAPGETRNGYVRATTDRGTEGWVPKRYLQNEPAGRDVAAAAQEKIAQLEEANHALEEHVAALKDELRRLEQLADQRLAFAEENKELQQRYTAEKAERAALEQTTENDSMNEYRKWFVLGVGTVLFGMLLGLMLPKLRSQHRNIFS